VGLFKPGKAGSGQGEKGEMVVNLTQWLSFFTYDAMNSLAFGAKASMIRDGDEDGVWAMLEAGQVNAVFMSHLPWLGSWILKTPWFGKDLKAFRTLAKQRAMQRKKEGSQHKDIFHHIMDSDGIATQPPSAAEVVSDGGLAIIAGADTTSAALAHSLYFLMSNPAQYRRLQAEIDALGEGTADHGKLAQLPYLNAVINESLRLLPPVLTGSQRIVEPGSGGKMIGSRFVPEGTITTIATYSMHRDPRSFQPLPETFLPERWLPEPQRIALEPDVFSKPGDFILHQGAFIPFSMGPANCVGKNLAWIEMRMCLALLVQRFEFKFDPEYDSQRWLAEISDYFVTKKGPLPAILAVRSQSL